MELKWKQCYSNQNFYFFLVMYWYIELASTNIILVKVTLLQKTFWQKKKMIVLI